MSKVQRGRSDPDEVRAKILEVAEEHFRRVGYQKTAVADIAEALGMSPANVYRFFSSKGAINECICGRVLDEAIELAWSIVRGKGTAAERLERLLVEMHRHNRETLLQEKRVHDMVAAAMSENWQTVENYTGRLVTIVEGLIREGIEAGEFEVDDPQGAASCVKGAYGMLLHPLMIEQCIEEDLDQRSRQMARFIIRALRPLRND
ncbi:TetR/AcrR family transcriptional regulator [Chthonobacter albigriseus]|uniref:TetR/AcrR family transcriptional regulator n=1 Tax=Chthonobacter albigriseus TaxID=1683161 RepID=UPI0015EE6481|nr:TetR/AcrR family transcriptional regulator [Chthonobacter albigriseus]